MNQSDAENIQKWHQEGLQVAADYARCEYRLVELLCQINESKGYLLFRVESLRQYALLMWGLPEHAVSDLVTVARKVSEIPALVEQLKLRRATVAKLRKICPVITLENQHEWLNLVAECSARVIEKAVAMARPEASVPQQMTYKAENLIELKVGISEATMLNLQRLQDVLSQKHRMDVSLSEAIAFLVEFSIDRLDPVRKAERAMRRSERRTSSQSEAQPSESPDMSNGEVLAQLSPSGPRVTRKRGKMPSSLVHLVQARDQGQCTHVDANLRHCPNRRWLEIHHLHPVSRGGPDDPENLTLLCSGHHKMTHAN